MNKLIEKLEFLNERKEEIIKYVTEIDLSNESVTKTQAQNLREYANRTRSVDELILYIKYQVARDRKLKNIGDTLVRLIKLYRNEDNDKEMEVVRYLLGTFTRWVIIEKSRGGK